MANPSNSALPSKEQGALSPSPITVSVIVPAYNSSATIGKTLEALLAQDYALPFEVIVVDDGSADNMADIVRSFSSVYYVRQDNAGPAVARNHGARMARGEFLAFTDSDCIPHKDWMTRLMQGFLQEQVGVVAGSYGIANPDSCLASCVHQEIRWRHDHLMPDYPNAFGSYNFCVRKDVFERVRGFDVSYRNASGEDNDLSYKIIKAGYLIYFQRKAFVDHYHPTRLFKYLKEQFRHGFWRVKMYADHPEMMPGDGYTFWKDAIEIPLAFILMVAVFLGLIGILSWFNFGHLVFLPILLFEMIFAFIMIKKIFEGIFLCGMFLLRAFARMFGFSTGILAKFF